MKYKHIGDRYLYHCRRIRRLRKHIVITMAHPQVTHNTSSKSYNFILKSYLQACNFDCSLQMQKFVTLGYKHCIFVFRTAYIIFRTKKKYKIFLINTRSL